MSAPISASPIFHDADTFLIPSPPSPGLLSERETPRPYSSVIRIAMEHDSRIESRELP
jgi:hypothetical protein